MLRIGVILLLTMPAFTQAEIYRWVDSDGVTHFSDRPPEGKTSENLETREVSLPPVNAVSNPNPPPPAAKKPESQSAKQGSKSVKKTEKGSSEQKKSSSKKYKDSLTSREGQVSGYDKQTRIADIEADDDETLSNSPSRKTLSQKLKAYNAAKTAD